MTLKSIKAEIIHTSVFGKHAFTNVDVMVDVGIKDFDASKHQYFLPGEVGMRLEREIAKAWLADKLARPRKQLKDVEVYAMMSMMGLAAVAFAALLGVSKGQMSKILKGNQRLSLPAALYCLTLFALELQHPGAVKSGEIGKLVAADLEPVYDARKLKKRLIETAS